MTLLPNLSLVPANTDLADFKTEMMEEANRPFRLRDAVTQLITEQKARPAEVPYTYVLVDCPPSLNLLTLNALVGAHAVLVPVQCEFFALEGISQLKQTIDQIKGSLNPGLEIQGVVLTMHDARTSLSKEVASEVRAFFGAKVYETMIPRDRYIAEAPSHGKPIQYYNFDCPGCQAYIQLAAEFLGVRPIVSEIPDYDAYKPPSASLRNEVWRRVGRTAILWLGIAALAALARLAL